jgi:hypothetical protein
MRRLTLLLLFSGGVVSQLGCATPAPVVRLDPIAENVFWVSGRAGVAKEERDVRVAASFERQVGKTLSVRVEIENRTEHKLEIDPGEAFSFVSCKGSSATSCAPETFVIDPEEMIAGIDQAASREQAQATDDARASSALLFLSAATDTASLADPHGGTAPLRTQAAESNALDEVGAHDRAQAGIESQREMWSNAALRHSTLLPGAGVAGQVFIPADSGTGNVWLKIRVGNRTFPFHFRQVAQAVSRNS